MSDDFGHYYDATVRLTKENEKLAGLLRFALSRGQIPYDFGPIDRWREEAHAALAAYEAGRAE